MTSRDSVRAPAIVVSITTSVALVVLSVRGLYVRWFADDYWIAAAVTTHGFWRGQTYWYRAWSGRYVFNFVVATVEWFGPRTAPLLVTITILAMVGALHKLRLPLALAMTWAILFGASDVPQSVLWQTGLFSYTIPIATFAWWLSSATDREWRWFDFIVPLAAGGCSETEVLAQVAVCAIALIAWRRKPLLAGLIGSLASLAIVAAAPGNAVRAALYQPMPPLFQLIHASAADAGTFFLDTIGGSGMMLVLVFLTSALLAPRVSIRLVIVAVISALACVLVTFGAAEVMLAQTLPQRAWIIPFAFLAGAVAAFGAAIPRDGRWRPAIAVALVIASVAPITTAVELTRDIADARTFARRWDRFDAFLGRNRGRSISVDGAPGSVGTLLFLGNDPDQLPNRRMSETYRLRMLVRTPIHHQDRPVIDSPPRDAVHYRFDDSRQ